MSLRIQRVRELLKRELGPIIQRDYDFGGALVTINDVDITPDLRNGHVFIGVIGSKADKGKIIEKLNGAHSHIQHRLASRVVLKYTPQLHFKLDESVERGVRVVSVIDDLGEIPEYEDEFDPGAADDDDEDEGDDGGRWGDDREEE
ncbi:MAG: 30S ribosome-binding factor RbfA [Verrucomicrobiales bacterium]